MFPRPSTLPLLVAPLILGCRDEGGAAPGTFGAASEEAREAAVYGAFGLGPLHAYLEVFAVDADLAAAALEGGGCPTATQDGSSLHVEADGCTGLDSGTRYAGALDLENVPLPLVAMTGVFPGFGEDPAAPLELAFAGWTSDRADGTFQALDGGFRLSNQQGALPYTSETDLRVERWGRPAVRRVDAYDCDDAGCVASRPLEVEVDGLAAFQVDDADFDLTDLDPHGDLVLVADDTLVVHTDTLDPRGCMDGEIEGAAVEICLGELAGGGGGGDSYQDSPAFGAWSFVDLDPDLGLVVGVMPGFGVASVDVDLADMDGGGQENHPLVDAGPWDEQEKWELVLTPGAYVPGVSTALPIEAAWSSLGAKVRARDAAGSVVGCVIFGTTDDETAQLWFGWDDCP